jgi:ABC-type taurine transport system ATPase subunit
VWVDNLKDIDVEILMGELVVITEVSGLGKSTCAFDTFPQEVHSSQARGTPLFKKPLVFLSTYAEDHGLCPWMNASSANESITCQTNNASVDFASGASLFQTCPVSNECYPPRSF